MGHWGATALGGFADLKQVASWGIGYLQMTNDKGQMTSENSFHFEIFEQKWHNHACH